MRTHTHTSVFFAVCVVPIPPPLAQVVLPADLRGAAVAALARSYDLCVTGAALLRLQVGGGG